MVWIDDVERRRFPLASRRGAMLIATPFMMTALLPIVSARMAPFLLLVALACLAAANLHYFGTIRQIRLDHRTLRATLAASAVLIAYIAVTAFWAAHPLHALEASARVLSASFLALVAAAYVAELPRPMILHLGEGLWIGVLIATLYVLVDIAMGQGIKLRVFNLLGLGAGPEKPFGAYVHKGRIILMSPQAGTRDAFMLPLLLWPTLMSIIGVGVTAWRRWLAWLAALLVTSACLLSASDTAKLAVLAGWVAFGLSALNMRVALMAVAAGWIVACLAIVPIANALHGAGLAESKSIPFSGRQRIMIWKIASNLALQSPWIGRGALSTYHLDETERQRILDDAKSLGGSIKPNMPPHPHNAYLQVWLEMGAAGALLLMTLGLAILSAISRLPHGSRCYVLAAFASAATLIASSYGIWQLWLLSALAMTVTFLAVGWRALETRPH